MRALSPRQHVRVEQERGTSISFDFKNGFLMYHVEVRKVRTNVTTLSPPEVSSKLGAYLEPPSR